MTLELKLKEERIEGVAEGKTILATLPRAAREARLTGAPNKGQIRDMQSLLDLDVEPMGKDKGRRITLAMDCPNCGASIIVANGGTTKCKYCQKLISFDDSTLAEDDGYDVSVQKAGQRQYTPQQIETGRKIASFVARTTKSPKLKEAYEEYLKENING